MTSSPYFHRLAASHSFLRLFCRAIFSCGITPILSSDSFQFKDAWDDTGPTWAIQDKLPVPGPWLSDIRSVFRHPSDILRFRRLGRRHPRAVLWPKTDTFPGKGGREVTSGCLPV